MIADWIPELAPAGGAWTSEDLRNRHVCDPALITQAVAEIGVAATAWAVETAERAVAHVRSKDEADGIFTGSTGRERQSSEHALLTALIAMHRGDVSMDRVIPTERIAEAARRAFRQAVPVEVLMHRVWGVHSVANDELLAAIVAVAPPRHHGEALREASDAMFTFANAFVRSLADAYERERQTLQGRHAEEQHRILAAVGDGAEPPVHARSVLGADFDSGHLYALAWPDQSRYIPDWAKDVAEFGIRAAQRLGAQRAICVEQNGVTHLWWSFGGHPPGDAVAVVRNQPRSDWLKLAIGPADSGLDGFRDSYQGAHQAARIGRRAAEGRTWAYDDVAHLALLVADPDAAARFVRRELGALLGSGPRLAEIRDTLRMYLSEGRSRVAVAKNLHLAPNTVAYRVGQASELLGRPVNERAQQILLALQLEHVLTDGRDGLSSRHRPSTALGPSPSTRSP